jgi:signal transduction histidine kinase
MRTSNESARPTARAVAAAHLARIEDLSFLRRLNERLTATPDFAAAVRTLVDLLHEELQAGAVAYVSVDPHRRAGRVEAVAPAGAEPGADATLALDGAPWAALLTSVEPTILPGSAAPPWLAAAGGAPGMLLVAATRVRGVTTGLIVVWEVGAAEPPELGEHCRLLAIVATLAALALDVARNQLREEFLAALRHDISNPVDAALGYTEMIVDTLQAEQRTDLLVLASAAAESMKTVADLVSNYLSMAVIDHGSPWLAFDEIDLGVLAAEVVRRFRPFAAERQVAIKCQGHCPAVRADRRQLGRVIGNLVSNAIKYTPPGGRVDVAVAQEAEAAILRVRDTGYGVPPERLPELFGKYVRLHRDKGIPGTGLGLYISRAIVEAHGGSIGVESAPGVGSSFTVRLPNVRADRPSP